MTAQRLAKYALVGWVLYIVLRIGLAAGETESPWFLGFLGNVLFLAIFAQQIYDWTRARTESEDRALFLMEFADLVKLSVPPAEALAKLVAAFPPTGVCQAKSIPSPVRRRAISSVNC